MAGCPTILLFGGSALAIVTGLRVLRGHASVLHASVLQARRIQSAAGIDALTGNLKKFAPPVPETAAALAAAGGDLSALRSEAPAALVAADSTGNTPLIWAADAGQTEALSFLLSSGGVSEGVDVNHRGFLGNTAMARAAQRGDLATVGALLAVPGINPNICNDKLQYPLHFAAFKCRSACVRLLLDSGKVSSMVLDRKGRTPAEDTKDAGIRQMILDSRPFTQWLP